MGNNSFVAYCARKRQLQVVPSCPRFRHIPPHCISANSCDRPGRHLIHCNYSCQFVQFVGKKKYFPIIRGQKYFEAYPLRPQKTTSSCLKLSLLSSYPPLIALVTIRATDPVAIYPLQLFVSIREIRGQYKFVSQVPPLIIKYSLFQPITHILSICEHSKT